MVKWPLLAESRQLSMTHSLYKQVLVISIIVLSITPVYADVSYKGVYITLAIIFGVLIIPAIIIAFLNRTRKALYFIVLALYGIAATALIWFINPSQNSALLILAIVVPYVILVIYLFKEKKTAK